MGHWFASTAGNGSMFLAIPVAMVAGLVSFFSPCVIPLLPGYLSYVTGLSGADLESARRGRMFLGAFGFVVGFSVVFMLLGYTAGAVGAWLFEYQRQITIVLGVMVIVLGLIFIGALQLLQRDLRIHKVPAVGIGAAPLLGMLFGLGWIPCVGPTLSAIIGLSAVSASAGRGMTLSFFYCLGLGVPFILAALSYRRAMGAIRVVRNHQVWVTRIGGAMLIVVGILLVTGWWNVIVQDLRSWFPSGSTGVI
ncbi:MAG: cytochrome c biogenesis CcdA family protein [Marmoricola sp.]